MVSVVIANEGDMAYRPDLYPSEIIVERVIAPSGGAYKIRAKREGKILGSKRSDLEAILNHFDLAIDSPLTVLTQDEARTFLQSATPTELYKVG